MLQVVMEGIWVTNIQRNQYGIRMLTQILIYNPVINFCKHIVKD